MTPEILLDQTALTSLLPIAFAILKTTFRADSEFVV